MDFWTEQTNQPQLSEPYPVRIGGRRLLANFAQLQVPKDDEVSIGLNIAGWKLKMVFRFDDQAPSQGIHLQPDPENPDVLRITLQKWSTPIGTSLKAPLKFAELSNGDQIELMAANYRIGETNLLSIQILSKGRNQ